MRVDSSLGEKDACPPAGEPSRLATCCFLQEEEPREAREASLDETPGLPCPLEPRCCCEPGRLAYTGERCSGFLS